MNQPPKEPANLTEFLWYVRHHEKRIFIRAIKNDKWDAVALADLPPQEWAARVVRFLDEGRLPVYVRDEEAAPRTGAGEPPVLDD